MVEHHPASSRRRAESTTADEVWTTLFERGGPALNEPVVLRGVGSALGFDFSQLAELFEALRHVDEDRRNEHVRTYRGSGLDRHAERRLFARLPQTWSQRPDSCAQQMRVWIEEALGSPPYTLVVNRAERWAHGIADCANALSQALFDRHALPSFTAELTVFLGNYQHTPFGIHLDGPEFRIIHAHLGPGPKRIYLWRKDGFDAQAHPLEHLESPPAELLETGTCFELRPGDLFLLPAQYYHIANCEPFGAGVAIVYRRETPQTLVRDALKRAQAALCEKVRSDADIFSAHAMLPWDENQETASLADWSVGAIERDVLLKKSALGWSEPPALAPRPSVDGLRGARLRRVQAYPLLWRRDRGRLEIFARHRSFSLAEHPAVIALLEDIGGDCCVEANRLCDQLQATMQPDSVLHLLSILVHYRAVEVIDGRRPCDCERCTEPALTETAG